VRTVRVPVTGGVRLAVDLWDGPGVGVGTVAFLLVHGLASNARLWDGVAERLAQMGHAVAAVDQRGHGRSDKPDDGYDFATVCDDLSQVLESLAAGGAQPPDVWLRPVVVGQSWGANVVLELAYRQPEALRGIACVDGGTIELADAFDSWEECAAAMTPPMLIGTPGSEMEALIRAMHPDWPESGVQGSLANFELRADGTIAPWLSLDHHLRILRFLWEHRPSTRYPAIKVPVLLVPADVAPAPAAALAAALAAPDELAAPADPAPDELAAPDDVAWAGEKHRSIDAALAALANGRAHWFAPADHDIHAQFPVQLAELLHASVTDGFLG